MTGRAAVVSPEVDYSANCRNCEKPIPKGKRRQREFCSDRCRAAFRNEEFQRSLSALVEACESMRDALEEQSARLRGLTLAVERFRRHKKKT